MMWEAVKLNFAEKILLLSYVEDKKRISYYASGSILYVLTAVSLFELCLRKKLRIEGRKVILLDMSQTGDEILDEMLSKISEKYDPKSATYWTTALSHGLQKKVLNKLVDKGILWDDYETFMIWFSRKCYNLSDSREFKALHEDLRQTLLSDKGDPSAEAIMIAVMVKNCGILSLHLNKEEIKQSNAKLKSYMKDESLTERIMGSELAEAYKAVNKALTEVKAATSGA